MWRRLPEPVHALLSAVLFAAADPRHARRLSFAALIIFPGALISFVLGVIALWRPHPEHAIGLWIWSAILFVVGSGIVAWAIRSSRRSMP